MWENLWWKHIIVFIFIQMYLHLRLWGINWSEVKNAEYTLHNVWQNVNYVNSRQCATVDPSGRVAEKHFFLFSSTNQIKFLISLWSNLCDSWTPPSPTYVWPLSEAWQPCHSRGQDNPKDVSSLLMPPWERLWSLLQLCTLNHISGNILPRQANHAWNQK